MTEEVGIQRSNRNVGLNNIPRLCIALFVLYWILIVAFYFLAGDQLHLRQSRGDCRCLWRN